MGDAGAQDRLELVLIGAALLLDHREILGGEVAQFHVGDEDRLRPLDIEADVEAGEPGEAFDRITRRRFGRPGGQQIVHVPLEQREQQALFVGSVIVERPGLDPDFAGDLAHRDGGKAVPGKKPQRRVADLGAGNVGMRALGACHGATMN